MSNLLGNYVAPVPAQQRVGKHWFLGSADAIYQSLNLIDDEQPDIVVIVGADNIYRMDFSQMVDQHLETGAALTVAGIRQPIGLADQLGVIDVDPTDNRKIREFLEKPTDVQGLADSPDEVLASMGNYVLTTEALVEALRVDSLDPISKHDMGGSIVPWFVERGLAGVHDFKDNIVPGDSGSDHRYWRDVGTVDAYYDAHQDLISVTPEFNLYNNDWPLFTGNPGQPPAKFVYGHRERLGHALDSLVSPGVIVSGGEVIGSVLSPGTKVNSWSSVRDSVVFNDVEIGRNATIDRAIVDKNVHIDDGAHVGVDEERDRERGFTVTESGITVVPKGAHVTR
jgi:glucose-1-phosphate adenylyltransferase